MEKNTHRFFQNALSLLALTSPTLFIAFNVVATNSREYRTGTLRRFSNSNVESYERGKKKKKKGQSTVSLHCGEGCTDDSHLLASCFPERLGPPDFSRIPLHLEVLVTFGGTETESFSVVTDKHGACRRWIS
jgi:hypothetical protein